MNRNKTSKSTAGSTIRPETVTLRTLKDRELAAASGGTQYNSNGDGNVNFQCAY